MRLKVKEQVKGLLSQENITQKELVKILSQKTGKIYTQTSLSQKLGRGSLTYNEVMTIAEILGYDIQFVKEKCEDIAISKYNQMMKGLEEYYGVEPKETPHEYSYQQGGHGFIKYKEKRI